MLSHFSFCTLGMATDIDDAWDISNLKEQDFEEFCVCIVHDRQFEEEHPNRAQASLPRNLTLKESYTMPEVNIQLPNIFYSNMNMFSSLR